MTIFGIVLVVLATAIAIYAVRSFTNSPRGIPIGALLALLVLFLLYIAGALRFLGQRV